MIYLKLLPGKEKSLERRHPWIFSGALKKQDNPLESGSVVTVTDHRGNFMAIGHFQKDASIAVRVLSFEDLAIDSDFWMDTVRKARAFRDTLGLTENTDTNAYRLIHGEGDGVPGLIIDIYNQTAVIQSHSDGILRSLTDIADAIKQVYSNEITTIYARPESSGGNAPDSEGKFLLGSSGETVIKENGVSFKINVVTGQKTGFFLDQRENRLLAGALSKGKTVLNCFCYSGGFSMYALVNQAARVDSVDISQKAMDLLDENLKLNNFNENYQNFTANVLKFLDNPELDAYEIVIVDPPAFAKSLHKRHNAVQAYKRLNLLALKKIKPGGFMLTFSCSQVVGVQLFHDTIMAACIESNRHVRIVRQLSQGPDHPVNIYHPEGHYLKGLLLYIED
jgi:23S rRNA (cytosine1962-C5)-methyltransferase